MFGKIMASVGIGSAKIDTVIDQKEANLGDVVTGKVYITGGNVEQNISGIELALKTYVEVESKDGEYTVSHTIDKWNISDKFTINPKEELNYDFELQIHPETPVTVLPCYNKSKVWIDTELDIDMGLDSGDKDYIDILAPDIMMMFIDAMDRLGFTLKSADVERGDANGPGFGSTIGCYQELEFRPSGFGNYSYNEIEATFIGENVLLEVDRVYRGDSYRSINISSDDTVDSIANKIDRVI
jgi:sporulation-control protein